MIISSAPGRCGIVGNPTDMYGGSVLSCTTVERARCTIVDSKSLVISVEGSEEEIRSADGLTLNGGFFDIPKAILMYFDVSPEDFKHRISITSDVPQCAGLAGSTAVVVAVLGAILIQLGIEMDPYQIAETARKVEYRNMGIMCGFQDQHMASFGGVNFMDFAGKESLLQSDDEPLATVEPLQEKIADIPIVIAHTGIKRNSGRVHRSIRERWLDGEPAVVEGYKRIASLARLGKKALLQGNWERLGELMNENHEIQRGLGGSGPQNDWLIDVSLRNGAFGAKLAGAGNGGTIIALTLEPDRTVRALRDAGAERILWPRPCEGLTVATNWKQQIIPNVAMN